MADGPRHRPALRARLYPAKGRPDSATMAASRFCCPGIICAIRMAWVEHERQMAGLSMHIRRRASLSINASGAHVATQSSE